MQTLRTSFFVPYKANEKGVLKPSLPFLSYLENQSGVYVIKSMETGKVVYVGMSLNSLYKTIYRHFQKWVDISRTQKVRFTYEKEGYMVRMFFCSPKKAERLERYLIIKLNPPDNTIKYTAYQDELNFDRENKRGANILEEAENLTIKNSEDWEEEQIVI